MPDYKYANPVDAAEASARIDHWMGDLGEFQSKLGLHDPGNGREPYYPTYSGVRSENSTMETMIAVDQKRNPSKWVEPVAPVASLKDTWLATLIRTQEDGKRLWKTWTDREFLKRRAKTVFLETMDKVKITVLGWFGEKSPALFVPPKRVQTWPTSSVFGGPPYDLKTYEEVKQDLKGQRDYPEDDGTIYY